MMMGSVQTAVEGGSHTSDEECSLCAPVGGVGYAERPTPPASRAKIRGRRMEPGVV
jgi:hypothetical protein